MRIEKILLCSSYLGSNLKGVAGSILFPIGLAYIASMLKEHELQCWDPNLASDPLAELSKILDRFKPDIVGLSMRNIDTQSSFYTKSYYEPFVSMIRTIKKNSPTTKLIVGGAGFSIFYREIMGRNPEIDIGVVGEGEQAIHELTENLDQPERVKNLAIRKGEQIIFTGRDKQVDFSSSSPPFRDGFSLEKYGKYPFSMGIQSKRGCNFKCIFCLHPFLSGSLRLRHPKKVVDEIEELVTNHDIREFFFVDSIFNFPTNHASEICQEIIRRKLEIRWRADFRPDYLNAKFM